ncbi:hypothetical protein CVS40_0100 [Lucilia cuprina]|nr:hypothetical protein CVS40_0100 [Lucilia cuprina]
MIQKGDDLINGVNHNYQYPIVNNNNTQMGNSTEFSGNSGNVIQAMSFEDYAPLESTLPPVETVLPQYIPTPPPSLPSPSVNISTVNTTIPQFRFQLQHQTLPLPSLQLQHNQNINNHQYYCNEQLLQHQQVGLHSSSFQVNHNNKNIESTINPQQLVVDGN